MSELRSILFFSYFLYSFFLPIIFTFLLLFYSSFSTFLIRVIILDTIVIAVLLLILYRFRNEPKRLWLYVTLIVLAVIITIRNGFMLILILSRATREFQQTTGFFRNAIDEQIDFPQNQKHPVWQIILFKQCCGTDSDQMNPQSAEYRWFTKTPFAYFCPGVQIKEEGIITFEQATKMKYSPAGPCLPLIAKQIKVEAILISLDLGFAVFLMLMNWLFIYRQRRLCSNLRTKKMKKETKHFSFETHKSSTVSSLTETIVPDLCISEPVTNPLQIVAIKPPERKRFYQGYQKPLDDFY